MNPSLALVDTPAAMRAALSPIRLRVLEELREPASAAGLAERLGVTRQKLGYHLRAREAAGLVRPAGERKKRGFTERLLVAAADSFVIDPTLLAPAALAEVETQDRHASSHLIGVAAEAVRETARMRQAAEAEGTRLLTLTVEADLAFAAPADFDAFADDLARAVADIARKYAAPGGRRYRLSALTRPAVRGARPATKN